MCIIVVPWLPLVALATIDLVGDNREFEVSKFKDRMVLKSKSLNVICAKCPQKVTNNFFPECSLDIVG